MCLCHELVTCRIVCLIRTGGRDWGIARLIRTGGCECSSELQARELVAWFPRVLPLFSHPVCSRWSCLTYGCHLKLSFLQHLSDFPQSLIAFPQDSKRVEANLQKQHFSSLGLAQSSSNISNNHDGEDLGKKKKSKNSWIMTQVKINEQISLAEIIMKP